ncbi:hypothetical protein M3Y94_00685900 [Aphelenchoides besseyi]|nr:hypothetical protein M3Y94_00685900 [Aphelenchoides besseyi]
MFVVVYCDFSCISMEDNLYAAKAYWFSNCTRNDELVFKWRKKHELWTEATHRYDEAVTLRLIVNNECEMSYKGNPGFLHYGVWTNENGVMTQCQYSSDCNLVMHTNGTLYTKSGLDVGCNNLTLRNPIDDEWVYTSIRVADMSVIYRFRLTIRDAYGKEEGEKYFPPTTVSPTPSTTVESTDEESLANIKTVSMIGLLVGFFVFL